MRTVISGAPGNFANRASPPPSGSTRNGATAATAITTDVRVVVAASSTSGNAAYQGWKDGASTTTATVASDAPCRAARTGSPLVVALRTQIATRTTASSTRAIKRNAGTASKPGSSAWPA